MEGKLRRCAVCLNEYKFCPKCHEDKDKPLFFFTFCSENCHNIYDVTSKFEDGKVSGTEAKKQLEKLDLSKSANFGTSYKSSINKINSSSVEIKKATMTVVKKIDDSTETEVTAKTEDENNIKKTRKIKKDIE